MRVLSFPFHITLSGTVATTTDYSQVVRGQAIDVLMTNFLERAQRARYGSDISRTVFDPRDSVSQSDLAQQVADRRRGQAGRDAARSSDVQPGAFAQDLPDERPVRRNLSDERHSRRKGGPPEPVRSC